MAGKPLLLVVLVLLAPVVPFVWFGDAIETAIREAIDPPPSSTVLATLVLATLASDILLPAPSSAVSLVAGAELGVAPATVVVWLGMTIEAMLGFALARWCGRPVAERLANPDDLQRIGQLVDQYGAYVICLARPLPVLAEATVLFVGLAGFSWRRFLLPATAANLAVALVYAVAGRLAADYQALPVVVAISLLVPVLLTEVVRRRIASR